MGNSSMGKENIPGNYSILPAHNMSSNVQDLHQRIDMWEDYNESASFKNPGEFNTVRLNEPRMRYKSDMNASAGNIKATKR